jgi:hypothetical protein
MKSDLAEMQAELRREVSRGNRPSPEHLAYLDVARRAAAIKRKSGQCAVCGDGIDPKRQSLCAWCRGIERARKEAQMRRDDLEFARKGYQILGPMGGRLWTYNGDPGDPDSRRL